MKIETIGASNETAKLLHDAADRGSRYLESLATRPVFPPEEAIAALAACTGQRLPHRPTPPEQVLAELDAIATPATVATAGPRYFGFVTGGALPSAVAAGMLACAWDQKCVLAGQLAGRSAARGDRARLARRCARTSPLRCRAHHRRHARELHGARRCASRAARTAGLGTSRRADCSAHPS